MTITGISSMATRQVLAELIDAFTQKTGIAVAMESVGGVDAAKRVQAGEAFDVVVLASDAIQKLIASGHLKAGSKLDLVHSGVAVAVRAGAQRVDIATEAAVLQAVRGAASIGFSTGPSGVALVKLFERWGIATEIQSRLVQAPPGVPVGALVARGEVALGFQQLSELMHLDGITVLGLLPPEIEIITTFSAGVCATCGQVDAVRALLVDMNSPAAAVIKQANGMDAAINS
jgi:molybdate transport system substrate-binding protein